MNKSMKKKLVLGSEVVRGMSDEALADVAGGMPRDTKFGCGNSVTYCATDVCSKVLC